MNGWGWRKGIGGGMDQGGRMRIVQGDAGRDGKKPEIPQGALHSPPPSSTASFIGWICEIQNTKFWVLITHPAPVSSAQRIRPGEQAAILSEEAAVYSQLNF